MPWKPSLRKNPSYESRSKKTNYGRKELYEVGEKNDAVETEMGHVKKVEHNGEKEIWLTPLSLTPTHERFSANVHVCLCERNDKGRKWIACFYCSIRHRHVKEVIDGTEERECVGGMERGRQI